MSMLLFEAARRRAYQIVLIIDTTLQGPSRSASVQQSIGIDPSSGPRKCMREEKQEEYNAQVVCCCGLCVSRHNFGTGNVASAAPSTGRHDHASSLRMRPI